MEIMAKTSVGLTVFVLQIYYWLHMMCIQCYRVREGGDHHTDKPTPRTDMVGATGTLIVNDPLLLDVSDGLAVGSEGPLMGPCTEPNSVMVSSSHHSLSSRPHCQQLLCLPLDSGFVALQMVLRLVTGKFLAGQLAYGTLEMARTVCTLGRVVAVSLADGATLG